MNTNVHKGMNNGGARIDALKKEEIHTIICDKNKISDQGCNGAPDWVIEIVDPVKQRVTVYFFGKESVEDYAFGTDVPVGIYDDFSIRIQ